MASIDYLEIYGGEPGRTFHAAWAGSIPLVGAEAPGGTVSGGCSASISPAGLASTSSNMTSLAEFEGESLCERAVAAVFVSCAFLAPRKRSIFWRNHACEYNVFTAGIREARAPQGLAGGRNAEGLRRIRRTSCTFVHLWRAVDQSRTTLAGEWGGRGPSSCASLYTARTTLAGEWGAGDHLRAPAYIRRVVSVLKWRHLVFLFLRYRRASP